MSRATVWKLVPLLAVLAACRGRTDVAARGADSTTSPIADMFIRAARGGSHPGSHVVQGGVADPRLAPVPDAPLPEGALARFGGTRLRDVYALTALAVSRDHRLIATGAEGARSVQIWDAASGAAVSRSSEDSSHGTENHWKITALAFAGDTLLAARGDNEITAQSTRDGAVRTVAACSTGWVAIVTALAVSPDGDRFAYDCDGSLVVQSTRGTERVILAQSSHDGGHRSKALAWSPDGAWIAASASNELRILDATSGAVRRKRNARYHLDAFAFAKPEQLVVIEDNEVIRHDLREDRDTRLGALCAHAYGAAKLAQVSSDGRFLVYAARCGDREVLQLVVLDLVSGARRELRGPQRPLVGVAFADAAGTELWLAHDHSARRWSVVEDREVLGPPGHLGTITALAYGPDGRTLVSGGSDGELVTWDLATQTRRSRELPTAIGYDRLEPGDDALGLRPGQIEHITWSADRAQMYTTESGRPGGIWRVWPADAGGAVRATVTHRLQTRGLVPLDGDVMLAIGSDVDGHATTRRLRASTGAELGHLTFGGAHQQHFALSPDRSTLVAIGDRRILLLDPVTSATRLSIPYPYADRARAFAWSPDGSLLAIAGVNDVDVFRIDRHRAVPLAEIDLLVGVANTLVFTADRRLIAGGWSGRIEIVDLDALDRMSVTSAPHRGGIRALALAPDGATFATAGDDGQILVWPLPPRIPR